ncbi:unnamed protein product [Symbiodinium sp. KB8]|nr:unnamed protein product [Symbiodinium sp. KB8]
MISRSALILSLLATAFASKLAVESGALQQDGILKLLEASTTKDSKSSQVRAKTSQMEDMVMFLAQQAKAAKLASAQDPVVKDDNANITDFVKQLDGELKKMLENVFKAAATSNSACQAAYDKMSAGCPVYSANTTFLPPDFDGDFDSLRADHKKCRDLLPGMKQAKLDSFPVLADLHKKEEYESCHKVRESLVGQASEAQRVGYDVASSVFRSQDRQSWPSAYIFQEQALLDSFRDVNIFESPDDCTISGDDVLAYYEAMRVHFKNRKDTFWETYYKLENVTVNITKFKCIDLEVAYFEQVAACETAQLKLEQTVHAELPRGYNGNWNQYLEEMQSTNDTIQDLKYEYRAIKRIECLMDAFAADDMDKKIDECIEKRHSTDLVNSTCVDNHENVQRPSYTMPDVCNTGVKAILDPNASNFDATEYTSQGITASRCMASCCTVDWYSWTTYGNAYVATNHYLIDEATGQPASFATMEDAKAACETMGSVHCFGIYDTKCDGASEESPVILIASPGLDLHGVEESAIGSCIVHMALGSGTTTTTTVVQLCNWEINISRADPQQGDSNSVWRSLDVKSQAFDEVFRFSGCTSSELSEAEACVNSGITNGVRVLKNRIGQAMGTGVCCGQETNKVLTAKRVQCDGYLDDYNLINDKYLTSTKLLRHTTYQTMEEARMACLRMGPACWGISDDKCDTVNFMLVDAKWNITADSLLEPLATQNCVVAPAAVRMEEEYCMPSSQRRPTLSDSEIFDGPDSTELHQKYFELLAREALQTFHPFYGEALKKCMEQQRLSPHPRQTSSGEGDMVLDEQFIQKCREAFNTFDQDGSGTIDTQEMKLLLEAIGEAPSEEELFRFMADVDEDGTGEIEFAEFLRAFEKQRGGAQELEDELDTIDAFVALGGEPDKTGYIDTQRLIQVVKDEFGMTIKIERLIEELDKDKDQKLDYREFAALFQ